MKFCQFILPNKERAIGLSWEGDKSIVHAKPIFENIKEAGETKSLFTFPTSMKAFVEEGENALIAAREVQKKLSLSEAKKHHSEHIFPYETTQLLAPLENPQKFFAVAINRHGGWDSAIKPKHPNTTYFIKLSSCIVGPKDKVRIPDVGQVGPEVELAIIIGRHGKDINPEQALDYVFGYTVHNDITAHQMRKTTEWIRMKRADGSEEHLTYPGRYKNFDTFSPMGPWLVTPDEAPKPDEAILDAWLNEDHVQHGSTRDHVYHSAHLISYLSKAHALAPGDIISTGTVGPVDPWTMATIDLGKTGGTIHAAIEGIGHISNPIEFVPGLK